MSDLDPSDLAKSLTEIPLFRELQRLLMSQSGPVNWEIANQVALAVSEAGGAGVPPSSEDLQAFERDVRVAELRLTQSLNLEAPSSIPVVEVLTRKQWADRNLKSLKPFIERFASRVQLGGEPQPGFGGSPVLQGALSAVGPLLFGVQVGFLAGYLARRVLGQYDLCLPREGAEKLYFLVPNIIETEREMEFDPTQFRLWISLHEVAHRLEFESIAWTRTHLVGLVERFIDAAQIESEEIVDKLQGLGDPEKINHLLQNPDQLLPLMLTETQQLIMSDIQAFLSVLEGYAEWAMDEGGRELLRDYDRMREAINRRRAERSSAERLLEGLLGVDLKLEQYRAGERFVAEVAKADQLSVLWAGPQALPTLEEVKTPSSWLSRVAFGSG